MTETGRLWLRSIAALALMAPGVSRADVDVANLDTLFAARESKASANATAIDDAVKASPTSYDVLWRAARWHCWVADGLRGSSHEKRQSEAESCMELGKRAVAVKPGGVEGNFYGANGAGHTRRRSGSSRPWAREWRASSTASSTRPFEIDPTFEAGGPYVVKGRYYYELPWPKRSYSKSAEMYHKALGVQPQNVRAQVYLARRSSPMAMPRAPRSRSTPPWRTRSEPTTPLKKLEP